MNKILDNKDFQLEKIVIGNYKVTYCLFKDEKKHPWNGINNQYTYLNTANIQSNTEKQLFKVINAACFSSLGFFIQQDDKKDYNRIIYLFKNHSKLSEVECLRWLLLAKQNKLLPRYANIKKILTNSNAVFDYTNISYNSLYVYLTIIRMMVEEPQFIKNVLVLVDKYGINYFAAFITAKYFGFNNFGHAFCCPSNAYPAVTKPDEFNKLQLSKILGLYRFIQQGCPDVDKKILSFSATTKVNSLSNSALLLDINKLINLDIKDVLTASTDCKAGKLIGSKIL